MPRVTLRSVLLIVWLTALVAIYAGLFQVMVVHPVELTKKDFISQYAAGRIANSGRWGNVYDLSLQIAQEEKILGARILSHDFPPFIHPPFILPLLALIAYLPYFQAYLAWAVFQLILTLLSAWAVLSAFPHLKKRKEIFTAIVFFFPVFISILSGQDSTLLLLGISLWMLGLLAGKDRLAGIGLALAAIRPQIAILLALPFLFKRRSVLLWFLGGTIVLGVFSFALIGINGTIGFLKILGVSASGEGYFSNETAMVNFLGWLIRWFPGIPTNIAHLAGWVVFSLVAVLLCIIWIRSNKIEEKQVGLAVLLAIFAAPHLHYHDLVLLLVPILCLMSLLKRGSLLGDPIISLFPLGVSWILLPSNSFDLLKYNVPYLVGLVLALALWYPGLFFRSRVP
jgi:hypothetical protein